MQCPSCGCENLPGADECVECLTSLTQEDVPAAAIRSQIEKSLCKDKVATLCPQTAVWVPQDTPLDVAVHMMRQKQIGCLLVTDETGALCGILTERDLINKVVGIVDDLSAETVSPFMTGRPETVQADQLLATALQRMMVSDLRYLPLVDEETHPEEIISSRDIIAYLTSQVEALGE